MRSGSPVRCGSASYCSAAEPGREAVVGIPERDVEVELVNDPQPISKSSVRDAAWSRNNEACQAIGWTGAGVVNGDHDAGEHRGHREHPGDHDQSEGHRGEAAEPAVLGGDPDRVQVTVPRRNQRVGDPAGDAPGLQKCRG